MSSTKANGVRTMDDAFAEMLASDSNAECVSDALRRNAPMSPGPSLVPVARYIDRQYHELEKKKLWSRVWQMAAHEDDFAEVGDVVPYDIADKSYLLVRAGEDEYKAYYNACLHRGRKLREVRARGLDELRCAFHGWTWNLDGSLKQVPCSYDFAGMDREEESLPEVKIDPYIGVVRHPKSEYSSHQDLFLPYETHPYPQLPLSQTSQLHCNNLEQLDRISQAFQQPILLNIYFYEREF